MIWEELNESLIFTGLEAEEFGDVMEKVGGALIREGYAKESYIEALTAREKEFPTGLNVDGIGVAIPHTDVAHVKKPGTAIAVLKKPVTFMEMGSDDEEVWVQLIFMLAVVNPREHIDRLQRTLAVIQDTEVLKQLLEAGDRKQIIEIIREKENTL